MRFRAAVLNEVGAPLAIDELEMQPLRQGDVRVRLGASGLCHTDLEVIQGTLAYPLPIVLGHEGAGVVEEVGAGVTTVRPGDHVILSWNPHCGHCFYCERDQPILCEPFLLHQPRGHLLDGTSRLRRGIDIVHHYSVTSTHAEYAVVPESGAVKVSREVPFEQACMIGCGVMTGVGGVVRMARAEPGCTVAVIGCGAVGLNAIQGARLAGAATIIAVDLSDERLNVGRGFGATHVVNVSNGDSATQVRDLTQGRGADYVIECAGNIKAFRSSVEMVRPGGQVVWLGKVGADTEVSFCFGTLTGERHIVRSSYGNARPSRDFPWLVDQYLAGNLMLDELITQRIMLEEINDGFELMARGEGIRTVIRFN